MPVATCRVGMIEHRFNILWTKNKKNLRIEQSKTYHFTSNNKIEADLKVITGREFILFLKDSKDFPKRCEWKMDNKTRKLIEELMFVEEL